MSKDTIKVNMNVYDIPILVEQLKKLEKENKQLKEEKKKLKEYIENNKKFNYDENSFECKVLFREMLEILGDKE